MASAAKKGDKTTQNHDFGRGRWNISSELFKHCFFLSKSIPAMLCVFQFLTLRAAVAAFEDPLLP